MPVEEAGNMLVGAAAVCAYGNSTEYAQAHWDVMTTWVGKFCNIYSEYIDFMFPCLVVSAPQQVASIMIFKDLRMDGFLVSGVYHCLVCKGALKWIV